jgi:hypothetical protein
LKKEKEKEEKEDENFQLLYYLSYMVKRDIGGYPNPCTLQNMQMIPHQEN